MLENGFINYVNSKSMKFRILYVFLLLIMISCKNGRKEVLLADREAPLGWVYLKMYDEKSFEFFSQGMMRDVNSFEGIYEIKNDTIYFKYKNVIPDAGSKAFIYKDYVNYFGGKYPERVEVKFSSII